MKESALTTEEQEVWSTHLPLGRFLSLVSKTYFGALTKRLEHLDLERHYSILILVENPEVACTQQYISDYLHIDKASMVRIIDALVKKGFIERVVNPADRREHHIKLTEKAQAIMPEIHKAVEEMNDTAFKGLTEEDRKNLYRCMGTMLKNVEAMPAHQIIVNYKKAK